jgi:hypothetical protein
MFHAYGRSRFLPVYTAANKLKAKLGIDPAELLRMFNGKMVPTKAVIEGLAKELDSDPAIFKSWLTRWRRILGESRAVNRPRYREASPS